MPVFTPVTMPEVPTVATVVLLLLHMPPGVLLASVVVAPGHTFIVPVIGVAVGAGVTILVTVAMPVQPVLPVTL